MDIDMGALRELVQDRGIDFETAVQTVEEALLAAYHRNDDAHEVARAVMDRKNGQVTIWAKVDGSEEETDATPENFGHIAVAKARQVVQNKLREAEEHKMLGEFANKYREIVSATIEPFEATPQGAERSRGRILASQRGAVKLKVGDVEAIMPLHEQVSTEEYKPGNRFYVYVIEVGRGQNGAQVVVSRSHPQLVEKLFKKEVPELEKGEVEIASIAREAGHRTKIAIKSNKEGVNPKGALIGPQGLRARAVMEELNGEKIDIIDWDENPAKFIANALSPAKAIGVKILDEAAKAARVVVPGSQLSLAIGREGQNARLAARLTGWKIDVVSDGTGNPEEAKG
jgi:N utilization substance protein A